MCCKCDMYDMTCTGNFWIKISSKKEEVCSGQSKDTSGFSCQQRLQQLSINFRSSQILVFGVSKFRVIILKFRVWCYELKFLRSQPKSSLVVCIFFTGACVLFMAGCWLSVSCRAWMTSVRRSRHGGGGLWGDERQRGARRVFRYVHQPWWIWIS